MNILISLAFLLVVAAASEFYSEEYHKIDSKGVAADDKQLLGYLKCLQGQGPCVGIQEQFKHDLPEAVQTACAKCTPIQKGGLKIFLEASKKKFPEELAVISKAVDPEGKYFPTLHAAIADF